MKAFLHLLLPIILASQILQPQPYQCDEDPRVAALLSEMRQDRWVNWIGALSGQTEVKAMTRTVANVVLQVRRTVGSTASTPGDDVSCLP